MASNIVRVEDLGCAFQWGKEFNELQWCPVMVDGTLDKDQDGVENWGYVDEDIVGDELVTYKGKEVTLSEVYRDVEKLCKKLGVQ